MKTMAKPSLHPLSILCRVMRGRKVARLKVGKKTQVHQRATGPACNHTCGKSKDTI